MFYFDGDNSPIVFQRPASHNLFGNIHLDFTELTLLNAAEFQFPARRNRAMLFPSTTLHYVKQNTSDTPRISLAFNTLCVASSAAPRSCPSSGCDRRPPARRIGGKALMALPAGIVALAIALHDLLG